MSLRPVNPATVLQTVADYFYLTPRELTVDGGRERTATAARQVACYVIREVCGFSYPRIAKAIGYFDHPSAMHSIKQVRANPTLRGQAAEIIAQITGHEHR